jgi:hypothetical protein
MHAIELVCPYCTGQFQVEPAVESRAATCPHCSRPVTVPAMPPPPPPLTTPPVEVTVRDAEPLSREGEPSPFSGGPPPTNAASPDAVPGSAEKVANRPGKQVAVRRRSPEERARYRRRMNVVYALAGLAILLIALAVLLRLGP